METADDATPSRLMSKPSWLLSQTSVHAHRLLSQALAAVGFIGYHYRLLAALEEFGPASQAALVQRSPDPADRRRNVIAITPAGTRQLRLLDGVLAGVQDKLLAPLSPTERKQLTRLLARVLEHHTKREPDAG
jgi:hypothetical protein